MFDSYVSISSKATPPGTSSLLNTSMLLHMVIKAEVIKKIVTIEVMAEPTNEEGDDVH